MFSFNIDNTIGMTHIYTEKKIDKMRYDGHFDVIEHQFCLDSIYHFGMLLKIMLVAILLFPLFFYFREFRILLSRSCPE